MSIHYRTDRELGTTFVLWHGVVTADEFLGHVRRLVADAEWPAGQRRHLSDLRTASPDASIDEAVLKEAADLFGSHPKVAELRAAIVAGEELARAGLFESLIRKYQPFVFVFYSLRPASAWLGIDAEEAERRLQSLRTKA